MNKEQLELYADYLLSTFGHATATGHSAMMYGKGGGGGAVAESAVPIQPGQLTIAVTVNVNYIIK